MIDEAYTGAIKESKKYFDIVKHSIPKVKVENLLKTKIIEYDCEDCITGKFIEVKDIKELLKDGGE